MHGTIDRVNAEERFGFIMGPNGEESFFHRMVPKGFAWKEVGHGVPVNFQATKGDRDRPDEHLRSVDVVLAPYAFPAVDNEPLPLARLPVTTETSLLDVTSDER